MRSVPMDGVHHPGQARVRLVVAHRQPGGAEPRGQPAGVPDRPIEEHTGVEGPRFAVQLPRERMHGQEQRPDAARQPADDEAVYGGVVRHVVAEHPPLRLGGRRARIPGEAHALRFAADQGRVADGTVQIDHQARRAAAHGARAERPGDACGQRPGPDVPSPVRGQDPLLRGAAGRQAFGEVARRVLAGDHDGGEGAPEDQAEGASVWWEAPATGRAASRHAAADPRTTRAAGARRNTHRCVTE